MNDLFNSLDKNCLVGDDGLMSSLSIKCIFDKSFVKTDNNGQLTIRAKSLFAANVFSLFQRTNNHPDELLIENAIKRWKENNSIELNLRNCSIAPLSNDSVILLSIKDENGRFLELICSHILSNKVYLNNKSEVSLSFNSPQLKKLGFSENVNCIPVPSNTYCIEVLNDSPFFKNGKYTIDSECSYWDPCDELVNTLSFSIDFNERTIVDNSVGEEIEGRGRRTSNGWERSYKVYSGTMARRFPTIKNLLDFILNLPVEFPQWKFNNCDLNSIYSHKHIHIDLGQNYSVEHISAILKLEYRGLSYTDFL